MAVVAKQFNNGKCDGWLQTQVTGDHFPIGYYEEAQVPILGRARARTTRFSTTTTARCMAATWPNRFYQLCAATDVDDTGLFPGAGQPRPSNLDLSIFDRVRRPG